MKVVLDTDIGTDADDAVALALCLASPELELLGVTIVHGDVGLRGRIARKIIHLAGARVPVAEGCGRPLMGREQLGWRGHEGVGVLDGPNEDYPDLKADCHAADLIIERVSERPGEVTVVTIGPMTNLALALIKEPSLADRLQCVVCMAGSVRGPGPAGYAPLLEHNVRCDPEAARIVFNSGIPLSLVPLDVTLRTALDAEDLRALAEGPTELHRRLAAMLERWFAAIGRRWAPMHDPLAVSLLIDRELLAFRPMTLDVITEGPYRGMVVWKSRPGHRVAVDVDASRFHSLLRSRLRITTEG